jgi:hypothetical protein
MKLHDSKFIVLTILTILILNFSSLSYGNIKSVSKVGEK